MSGDHNMNQTSPGWRKRQIMDMESKGTSMTKDEALNHALKLVSNLRTHSWTVADTQFVITAIKKALAQPEQKEKFCDSNCVWTDHHPDCNLAQSEQDTVQRLSALVRAQQITIDKLEAQPEQEPDAEKYLCAFCRTHFPEPLKPPTALRRRTHEHL